MKYFIYTQKLAKRYVHTLQGEKSYKKQGLCCTCCFSTRKDMVLIPRKQSQQSNGANPLPSAFCRNAIAFAKLVKMPK